MEIRLDNDGNFTFNGEYESDYQCDICCNISINNNYKLIIDSLKEKGILENDFPYICCQCFNLAAICGTVYCPNCSSLLSSFLSHTRGTWRVFCVNKRCVYYDTELESFKDFDYVDELWRYDPIPIILEEWKSKK